MINQNEILSAFIVLFAVIDVIGAIPLIIAIKEKSPIRPGLATIAGYLNVAIVCACPNHLFGYRAGCQ